MDKKITLYDVITNPNDGFVYLIDIDDETNFSNCQIVQISQLPDDYIPSEDSFYNFELRDDINLSAISQKYSSGILEIHISGRDVKYGSIPLHKFAPIIPKIEDIRIVGSSCGYNYREYGDLDFFIILDKIFPEQQEKHQYKHNYY